MVVLYIMGRTEFWFSPFPVILKLEMMTAVCSYCVPRRKEQHEKEEKNLLLFLFLGHVM